MSGKASKSISMSGSTITWEDIEKEAKKLGLKRSAFLQLCVRLYFRKKYIEIITGALGLLGIGAILIYVCYPTPLIIVGFIIIALSLGITIYQIGGKLWTQMK